MELHGSSLQRGASTRLHARPTPCAPSLRPLHSTVPSRNHSHTTGAWRWAHTAHIRGCTTRKGPSVSSAKQTLPALSSGWIDASKDEVIPLMLRVRIGLARTSQKLDLTDMRLRSIPSEVFELTELEDLSLAGNCLVSLPPEIGQLKSLKRLGLAGNRLTSLPDSLGQLQQLEGLWMHGNLLEELPAEAMGSLSSLKVLVVSGNRLTELPDTLGRCSALQELSAAGNWLQTLPNSIGQLHSLKKLVLNGNYLKTLPADLAGLTGLKELWLQGNELTGACLESWLPSLCALEQLCLADNQLPFFLASMESMPALTQLWLYGNHLSSMPDIAGHPKLSSCWLEGNPLEGSAVVSLLEDAPHAPSLRHLGLDLEQLEQACGLVGPSLSASLSTRAGQRLKVAGAPPTPSSSAYGAAAFDPASSSSSYDAHRSSTYGHPASSNGYREAPEPSTCEHTTRGPGYFKLALGPSTHVLPSGWDGEAGGSGAETHTSGKAQSGMLVVAFGSAPGTPNWAGLLSRLYKAAESEEERDFDVLYVVDPARDWFGGLHPDRNLNEELLENDWRTDASTSSSYDRAGSFDFGASSNGSMTNGNSSSSSSSSSSGNSSSNSRSRGHSTRGTSASLSSARSRAGLRPDSLAYYRERIQQYTQRYKHVLMLGDSMGATACLLFSPLATSVIAFCPQVDLMTACMRPGASDAQLAQLYENVVAAVNSSQATIHVHTGTWEHDLEQAKLLPQNKVSYHKVYNLDSHRLALYLESQSKLLPLVQEVMMNTRGISAKKNMRISNVL